MRDYIRDRVEEYILKQIKYLNKEEEVCGFDRERYSKLVSLETMSDLDIEDVVDKIIESEDFYADLDTLIHDFLKL